MNQILETCCWMRIPQNLRAICRRVPRMGGYRSRRTINPSRFSWRSVLRTAWASCKSLNCPTSTRKNVPSEESYFWTATGANRHFNSVCSFLALASSLNEATLYCQRKGIGYRLEDLEVHASRPRANHTDLLSREVGQVDDAVFDERATVVDAHRDGFAIGQIAHFDDRVERQGAMRRGHRVHIVSLTVGSSTPVIGMAIPRSVAGGLFGERSD